MVGECIVSGLGSIYTEELAEKVDRSRGLGRVGLSEAIGV